MAIEKNDTLPDEQKLHKLYSLKNKFEVSKQPVDSVYARILHKIGLFESIVYKDYNKAIFYTLHSVRINISGKRNCSKSFAVKGFYNIGIYYDSLLAFDKALVYFDSAILLGGNFPDRTDLVLNSRLNRVYIFFQIGDYQKYSEESVNGMDYCLLHDDSLHYLYFFNHKAQSLCLENQLQEALSEIEKVIQLSDRLNNLTELATALTTKALIYTKKRQFYAAISLYTQAIKIRGNLKNYEGVAHNYNDLGNLYLNFLTNHTEAEKCYFRVIEFAERAGDDVLLSNANVNLGQTSFIQEKYLEAAKYCVSALQYLRVDCKDILTTPTAEKLNFIDPKELTLVIMRNKTELLLKLFNTTHEKKYLNACLQTALVTDTIINQTRHEQSGEQSKLFWRDNTKRFYVQALDACFFAKDENLAFYFMEKSRAALLNDKLNELGAAAYLPDAEAAKQQNYRANIIEEQQKLSMFNETSAAYANQQLKLLQAKDEFERYIKSLEEKYPSYYQYKYADEVPSLSDMQKYLALNNQSFIHYFISDTLAFILATTHDAAKFIRLPSKEFDRNSLTNFQQLCANKQLLQNNYPAFAKLAKSLYKALFKPLQIPPGRVIICADDFLVPFEAFCTDSLGKKFLIYDYAFSYVYSAGYLLKRLNPQQASGNFLGIAPVSFASYAHLPNLSQSADAIKASAQYYTNSKLLLLQKATWKNFFKYSSDYSVVTVLSHASADTSDSEPVIFMNDSIIHLSELLYLDKPSTQLVILSACQTDVGKKATGEGIYSLARGFSAAGIPAVAATLWQADDQAIYTITETFNRNIAQGMQKDVALQNAELSYLKSGTGQNMLPYYWANMIIAGNTQPVRLSGYSYTWLIITTAAIIIFASVLVYKKRSKV